MSNEKYLGTVKWFSAQKGYGFLVAPDLTSDDIFVHYSVIEMDGYRSLKENESVEFELISSDRGPQAAKVKPLVGSGK